MGSEKGGDVEKALEALDRLANENPYAGGTRSNHGFAKEVQAIRAALQDVQTGEERTKCDDGWACMHPGSCTPDRGCIVDAPPAVQGGRE